MDYGEEEMRNTRQEDEFEALQSIYSGDIIDLRRSDAWQIKRPPEMLISLRPLQSSTMTEAHARIDLHIRCPSAYPDIIPEIVLKNPKGLSDQKVKILHAELHDLALKRVGMEMIYELCNHAESYLHDNNLPPRCSFYDEMIYEQNRVKEEKAKEDLRRQEILRKLEEDELKELEEQLRRKEQERREDAKRYRDLAMQKSASPESRSIIDQCGDTLRNRTPSETVCKNEQPPAMISPSEILRAEEVMMLKFCSDRERRVHRGKCIGSSAKGSHVFVGLDSDTGNLVAITQWEVPLPPVIKSCSSESIDFLLYKNQMLDIESELQSLIHLAHPNIIIYLGMNTEIKSNCIRINILSDYVGGGNLENSIQSRCPLSMDKISNYARQTLMGLLYLHKMGIVHKSLRLSCLFLDSLGQLKISDYSIHRRITDFVHEIRFLTLKDSSHFSPITHVSTDDIFQMGLLMLSLAVGTSLTAFPSNFPSQLPPVFIDFLKHCTADSVGEDTSQLLNHSFIRTPLYCELSTSGGSFFCHSHCIKRHQASKATEDDDTDDVVDNLLLQSISSESRLKKEFKILQMIGSGGFGDVIKVRNFLDNRCYAIKRISLNPAWHKQYKKLTREVEVLSKLNHENIVRYFNSWLETCEDTTVSDNVLSHHVTDNETDLDDEDEKKPSNSDTHFALGNNRTAELWSEVAAELDDEEDSYGSSEFSDSYLDVFDQSQWISSPYEEDFIIFEKTSEDTALKQNCEDEEKANSRSKYKGRQHNAKKQYLYIQMEYCEKRTLRDCIDKEDLYRDVNRVWELFREIVEGLAHIHDQGIIHRDLKPVNIFLDSEYHVKIGDFGLATAYLDIIAEPSGTVDMPSKKKLTSAQNDDMGLTGRVGTTLYVSPEMETSSKRYNLKVDIYSLGIIFFEMCYRPMTTQMERIQILSNIRKEVIEFPSDFHEICLPDQAQIICLLLDHDPFKRPTAKELLKSEYLPLSQIEESQIYDVLDMTISNTEGRTYKHMLHKIFMQPVQTVTDFLYDANLFKASFTTSQALVQQTIASNLELIFKRHSAFRLTVPLLMPSSSLYECDTYVTMMDRSGGLVSLPYDMMVPFARFVARAKMSSNFRRYSIDRVFRECRPSGVHPRQLLAASFDIVRSSTGSLYDDTEVIYVVYEIIKQFPALNSGVYQLRLNHVSLMTAILLHCGVPDEHLLRVCTILGDGSIDRHIQRQKLLNINSLSEVCVDMISSFLQREDTFERMSSFLRCISKSKSQAASLVKKGLYEIENVISHLSILGCTLQPIVSLSLVSNIHFFSGILFQVMHEGKRKKKTMPGVLAAGGRYDNLIAMFRKPTERQLGCPQAVGFSISFDKIVNAAMDHGSIVPEPLTELLICTIGQFMKKDLVLKAARRFWEMGVPTSIYQDSSHSMDEIKAHCRQHFIPYILASIMRDAEQIEWILVKVQLEKERILKKDKNLDCLIEFFQKLLLVKVEISEISRFQASSVIQAPTDTGSAGNMGIVGGNGATVLPSWNVTFALQEGKETNRLHKNTRRAYEAQIDSGIQETLAYLNVKNRVEVIATELPSNILKAFAAHFEPNRDEGTIMTSIGIKDGQKASCRKYLMRLIGEIKDLRSKHKMLTIILYSLADDIHRVLPW